MDTYVISFETMMRGIACKINRTVNIGFLEIFKTLSIIRMQLCSLMYTVAIKWYNATIGLRSFDKNNFNDLELMLLTTLVESFQIECITPYEVKQYIQKLNPNKSTAIDGIGPIILLQPSSV